jgi:hypothetical protein
VNIKIALLWLLTPCSLSGTRLLYVLHDKMLQQWGYLYLSLEVHDTSQLKKKFHNLCGLALSLYLASSCAPLIYKLYAFVNMFSINRPAQWMLCFTNHFFKALLSSNFTAATLLKKKLNYISYFFYVVPSIDSQLRDCASIKGPESGCLMGDTCQFLVSNPAENTNHTNRASLLFYQSCLS